MKLILHLLAKDLRRMAPAVGIYLLILGLVSAAAVKFLHFDSSEGSASAIGEVFFMAALVLSLVVAFMLTASLLREDPVRDAGAFWISRPIAGWQLLAEKLLATFVLVVLPPFLAVLPWWVGEGLGLDFMLSAGTVLGAIQVAAIFLALLCSLFIRRDTSLLIILFLAILGLVILVYLLGSTFGGSNSVLWDLPYGLRDSRQIVALVLLVGTVCGAFVHFYLTRRFLRSLAVLATGLGLCILSLFAWPWAFSESLIAAMGAKFDRIRIEDCAYQTTASSVSSKVRGSIVGLDSDETLKQLAFDGVLLKDGKALPVRSLGWSISTWGGNRALLLGEEVPVKRQTISFNLFQYQFFKWEGDLTKAEILGRSIGFSMRRAGKEAEVVRVPELKALWTGQVMKIRSLYSLPLVEDAVAVTEFGSFRIESVKIMEKGRVEVSLRECNLPIGPQSTRYYLVDHARHRMFDVQNSGVQTSMFAMGTTLNRTWLVFSAAQMDLGSATRSELLEYLRDLRVEKLGWEPQGRIQRQICIPSHEVGLLSQAEEMTYRKEMRERAQQNKQAKPVPAQTAPKP